MHGIQNFFRQHEIDRQSSMDTWEDNVSPASEKDNDTSVDSSWQQGKIKQIRRFYDIRFTFKPSLMAIKISSNFFS